MGVKAGGWEGERNSLQKDCSTDGQDCGWQPSQR